MDELLQTRILTTFVMIVWMEMVVDLVWNLRQFFLSKGFHFTSTTTYSPDLLLNGWMDLDGGGGGGCGGSSSAGGDGGCSRPHAQRLARMVAERRNKEGDSSQGYRYYSPPHHVKKERLRIFKTNYVTRQSASQPTNRQHHHCPRSAGSSVQWRAVAARLVRSPAKKGAKKKKKNDHHQNNESKN